MKKRNKKIRKKPIVPLSQKLIVIVGPTASGKSEFAVTLAQKFNGEIISADSRQIYKGMNIGSGKITQAEMKGVPHRLLDIADPKRTFTVAHFQKHAHKAIEDILKRGKLPVLCGGTGFYIQSLIDGLVIPEVKPKPKLRRELFKKSTEELFKIIQEKDKERAKNIDAHNKVRLVRALEIIDSLGKVPKIKTNPLKAEILIIGIKKEKEILQKLIKIRLLKRIKKGLIKEVINLHNKQKISWKKLESFGLEYRYAAYYLQNKISKNEMIKKLLKEIGHYAKRQMTWFKRDKRINWIKNQKEALDLINEFIS
ncbi:MAG: tRNA (adenosine(37)-N6)-dimethylallyltransferase MiaA [Patescibacteria group bacterium]|nr:tRNA (adenosine(37)-N6)-dimethylallyltransferase MiaA [Patescibacteria group bacterium]